MKKIALLTIVSCLVMSNQAKAGVPVIDAGSIAQAVIQVQEAKKRYETLKQQFQAATGNAQLGILVSDPSVKRALNAYMPEGYGDVATAMANGNIGALQGLLDNVKQNEASFAGQGKERLAATMLVNEAKLNGLLKNIGIRSANVDRLITQVNSTTDLSSKADLGNTLASEQANINADMNKMNVLMKQMDMQQKLAENQAASEFKKQQTNIDRVR